MILRREMVQRPRLNVSSAILVYKSQDTFKRFLSITSVLDESEIVPLSAYLQIKFGLF